MLHLYWQNLLTSKKNGLLTILVMSSLFSFPVVAQTSTPGMVTSLKKMITVSNAYFKKIKSVTQTFSNKELETAEDIDFPPPYINSLLLYTEANAKSLMTNDVCSFYNLMINDLMNTPAGAIERIPVRVKKGVTIKTGLISRAQFLNQLVFKKCPSLKVLSNQFSISRLQKTITVNAPTKASSKDICLNNHKEHLVDDKTAFFCGIVAKIERESSLREQKIRTNKTEFKTMEMINQKIKTITALKRIISNQSFEYYNNLCHHLNNSDQFCKKELSKNIFVDINKKQADATPIYGLCQSLYRKKLSATDLKNCALELSSKPDLCHYSGNLYPALYPKPNCEHLSKALSMSRINNYYQDCPGQVGNESVVNLSRLYLLMNKTKMPKPDLCFLNTTASFLSFLTKVNFMEAWQNEFCFIDPVSEKKSCVKTLQGNFDSSPYSEEKSLSRSLSRTRGIPDKTKCRSVKLGDYNPNLLKHSEGCVIVYNPKNCYGTICEQRIFIDKKEITHLEKNEKVKIEYFSTEEARTKYSAINLLRTHFKKKTKKIMSSSAVKSFLKNQSKGIIHGIGCAEKLLPHFINQTKLHQCTVTPFIVAGLLEQKGNYSLVVHTSMDDINTPRIIDWSMVFQAVKAYQNIHPRKVWGLNGLY